MEKKPWGGGCLHTRLDNLDDATHIMFCTSICMLLYGYYGKLKENLANQDTRLNEQYVKVDIVLKRHVNCMDFTEFGSGKIEEDS